MGQDYNNKGFYEVMGKEFSHGAKFGLQTALDMLQVFGYDIDTLKSKIAEELKDASETYEELKTLRKWLFVNFTTGETLQVSEEMPFNEAVKTTGITNLDEWSHYESWEDLKSSI